MSAIMADLFTVWDKKKTNKFINKSVYWRGR